MDEIIDGTGNFDPEYRPEWIRFSSSTQRFKISFTRAAEIKISIYESYNMSHITNHSNRKTYIYYEDWDIFGRLPRPFDPRAGPRLFDFSRI